MAKMIAWSVFPVELNEYGQTTKSIMPGDAISQAQLGVSDEEWDNLVEAGAVREDEYPTDLPLNQSPAEAVAQKQAQMNRNELSAEELEDLRELQSATANIASAGTVSGEAVNADTEKAVSGPVKAASASATTNK